MKTALLLMFAAPLWAVSNSVTITDTTGSTQTNRPFSISRVFAQGEISGSNVCAQPRIGGTPVAMWQCDRKTSWGDGSLAHAIISFTATVNASSSITVDFVGKTTYCSSGTGSLSDCQAAALNGTGMLNFNSGNWGAAFSTNLTNGGSHIGSGGTVGTVKARDIVSDGNFRYWLQGPVVTQVIAEDRTATLAYDMGNDSSKVLHPYFVLTFYTGWTGVKEEFIMEGVWLDRHEDQTYNVSLLSGSALGTTQESFAALKTISTARWHRVWWDGTVPGGGSADWNLTLGGVKIDLNLPYIISTKVVPNFDTSVTVTASMLNNEMNGGSGCCDNVATGFNNTDKGVPRGTGQLFTNMLVSTGGRFDIGIFPTWDVFYLFTFDPTEFAAVLGNASAAGSVPVHVRMSDNAVSYDGTHPGFGHTTSLYPYPNVSYNVPGGTPTFPCLSTCTSDGWTPDPSHQPNLGYIPYLVTGDFYWVEELYFWASYNFMRGNPGTDKSSRHGAWGYMNQQDTQIRGQAWAMRTLADAAFMAPDNDPEKLYFRSILDNNIAVFEGLMGLTTGNYYDPSSTSMWYWGHNTIMANTGANTISNTLLISVAPVYLDPANDVDPTQVCSTWAPWMENFKHLAFGHIEELGFTEITPVRKYMLHGIINGTLDPSGSPYLIGGGYWIPTTNNPGGLNWNTTPSSCWTATELSWAGIKANYNMNPLDPSSAPGHFAAEGNVNGNQNDNGWASSMYAALSFAPGITTAAGFSGTDAWNWIHTNYPAPTCWTGPTPGCDISWASLKFDILPRPLVSTTGGSVKGGKSISAGKTISLIPLQIEACGQNQICASAGQKDAKQKAVRSAFSFKQQVYPVAKQADPE